MIFLFLVVIFIVSMFMYRKSRMAAKEASPDLSGVLLRIAANHF